MKILLIIVLSLVALFAVGQIWISNSNKNIETYEYTVVKEFDDFEIRQYESANFAYVTMPRATYKESSSQGFRMLAGYIFGGNETGEKIAMTSPVAMSMEDSMTMQFMVPDGYSLEDMPTPNNSEVRFKREPGKTMAAIQFGGWANDEKIKEYTTELRALLEKEGIQHMDNFSFLGYNPPYDLINRRNEVVVEVVMPSDLP